MQQDADENADADKEKKELVDVRNMAESMIFSAEKSIKEYADQVDEETKTKIEDALKALKEVKDTDDKEAIDKKTAELSESMQKIGEIMQKKAAESEEKSKDEGDKEEEEGEGETVDVESEEATDEKKDTE